MSDPTQEDHFTFSNLALTLKNTMGPESHSPETALFVLQAARTIARGIPVAVSSVAESLPLEEGAIRTAVAHLEASNQIGYDNQGHLVAIAGLSLSPTNHSFEVEGVQLYTWCAIDALFFPSLLDREAVVESTSPISKKTIRLIVTPRDGVRVAQPSTAAVSLVVPASTGRSEDDRSEEIVTSEGSCDSLEISATCCEADRFGANGSFCSRVHYFESLNEAESWLAGSSDVIALSVSDAYRLAQEVWAEPLLFQASRFDI